MTRPAWLVVRLLSCVGLVWLGWQLVLSARQWSQVASAPLGDVPAAVALRLFSGAGALLFGTYTLVLAAKGGAPYSRILSNFHVLEAVAAVALIGALLTAVAAVVLFPPVTAAIAAAVTAPFDAELVALGVTETDLLGPAFGPEFTNPAVIGSRPLYANFAEAIGLDAFSIPDAQWEAMSVEERWAANRAFLDEIIAEDRPFRLVTPIDDVRPGSCLEKELEYLTLRGYQLTSDGMRLVSTSTE